MEKILSPREFKLKNPNSFLGDYITYLEESLKEVEEALTNAQGFQLEETHLEPMKKQAEQILKMTSVVENYMGQIVLKSIDTLTLEELQTYFNFDAENKASDEKKLKLENDRKDLNTRLDEIKSQIKNNLYLNGRVKEFYEIKDVDTFFAKSESVYEFLVRYLEKIHNLDVSSNTLELENVISELRNKLYKSIKTECDIQNIYLSEETISELSKKIIELFIKCKNILRYSPEAKEELSKFILSESGIKENLSEKFDQNTAENLVRNLMNLTRLNTNFYKNLPENLQEELAKTRLQGEPYDTLLRVYQALVEGKEIPVDDLNRDELQEQEKCEKELDRIKYDLASLDTEKENREKFLLDAEAMRSVLRKEVAKSLKDQISASNIESIVKGEDTRKEKLKQELKEASDSLSTLMSNLTKAQRILVDGEYNEFFEGVELNSRRRIYQGCGVQVTEEVILPVLEEEKRRYKQLEIMINLENELSRLYDLAKEKKDKANFINRHLPFKKDLPFYKKDLKKLNEEYQNAIKTAFEELKQNHLIYINVPKISEESTVGNVIVLPPEEVTAEPTDFSGVCDLKQTFWYMTTGIDENTKRSFLAMDKTFNNWDDYYKNLTDKQSGLITKLFHFDKNEDGYLIFDSSKDERESLKQVQNTIVQILSSIYEERKALRERLCAPVSLDLDKVAELKGLLGERVNLSRENLALYIEQTKDDITKVKELLSANRDVCETLGIEFSEDVVNTDNTSKEDNVVEEQIQKLNIEGVTDLEGAIEYLNFLLELESYSVPAPQVKEYYLKNTNR